MKDGRNNGHIHAKQDVDGTRNDLTGGGLTSWKNVYCIPNVWVACAKRALGVWLEYIGAK